MKISVWIPGDQLLAAHPAIEEAAAAAGPENVAVCLLESAQRLGSYPIQKKRMVLLLSAMRHYAAALRAQGFQVDYRAAADFLSGLQAHCAAYQPDRLLTMAASSFYGRKFQHALASELGLPVTVLPNTQFLIGRFNPIPNPPAEKRVVMETFYRDMRRRFNLLMDGDEPAGGRWNFDRENRKPLPETVQPPPSRSFQPDEITRQVMAEAAGWAGGIGTVDGFNLAVTHAEAAAAADDFFTHRFSRFGEYEDALTHRSHALFHATLSPYLNIGLLEPLPLLRRAETLYRAGAAPINSVEGFIRQILGWREFMAWQYWRQMPGMKAQNSWQAQRPLPDFVWNGETEMACLRYALRRAIDTGYNHHIERLMLLSNFFMLCGINPRAANDWFMSMYIDACEWVMPPNVIGMGLNADGGLTATKPYIASANYINKMGDHCAGCHFDHKKRHGENACPFNFLYWNFVLQHEERLRANPRTARSAYGLRHLDAAERERVRAAAAAFISALNE